MSVVVGPQAGDLILVLTAARIVILGQQHGLDHVESLLPPVFQICIRLLPAQLLEQLPAGVTQPEEAGAVFVLQEMPVVGDPEWSVFLPRSC